ncbi:uncharacterized protein LOC135922984 isoform X2 [Gordionus sp. m RMFG-2023]|uniref:uncharacterized protein LOC135922984 isoform X2 n=1 Tax=Gordionus sp. m RMFG-2023 TaxID=3053472 RepID=UPI0031FD0080
MSSSEAAGLLESIITGDFLLDENNMKDMLDNIQIIDDDNLLNEISSNFINGIISFQEYQDYLEKGIEETPNIRKKNVDHDSVNEEDWKLDEKSENSSGSEEYIPYRKSKTRRISSQLGTNILEKSYSGKLAISTKTRLPKHLQGLMGTANMQWASGQKLQAKEICNEIIKLAPSACEPYSLLSLIYEEIGDSLKSYQYSVISAHLDSNMDPNRWVKLAKYCKTSENYNEAIKFYKKAIYTLKRNTKKPEEEFNLTLLVKYSIECASMYEELGEIKKAILDYQRILFFLNDFDYASDYVKTTLVSISEKISRLYYSLNDSEAAYTSLNKTLHHYAINSLDMGTVNLYVDLLVNTKRFINVLDILGNFCGIDLISASLLSNGNQHTDKNDGGINDVIIPDNFPIDFQNELAISIINLQKFASPYLHAEKYHHFRTPYYDNITNHSERSLIELDPNLFGDLYIDLIEAYKMSFEEGAGKNCETCCDSNLDRNKKFLEKALVLYHRLLGIKQDFDKTPKDDQPQSDEFEIDYDYIENPTIYSSVPGIWLSYSETLESFNETEKAYYAMKKVVSLAPEHQITRFKLKTLEAELLKVQNKNIYPNISAIKSNLMNVYSTSKGNYDDKNLGMTSYKNEDFEECPPFPSDNITLELFSNLMQDQELFNDCLHECLKYPTSSFSAPNRDRFLSLGISTFFSMASDSLKISSTSMSRRNIVLETMHFAEIKLGKVKERKKLVVPARMPQINHDSTVMSLDDEVKEMGAQEILNIRFGTKVGIKMNQLFGLLVKELLADHSDHAIDNIFFLFICASANINAFSGRNYRKNIRLNLLLLTIRSRRWHYAIDIIKSVLILMEMDPNSNKIFYYNLSPNVDQCLINDQILDIHATFMNILMYTLRPKYVNKFSSYFSTNKYSNLYTINEKKNLAHMAKAHKPIIMFILKRLRLLETNDYQNNLKSGKRVYFIYSLAYACLNLATGCYGIALSELKNVLSMILDETNSHILLKGNEHARPLIFLMLGTTLLNISCHQPYYIRDNIIESSGLKKLLNALTAPNANKFFPVATNVPLIMLPLTYAFICFSIYLHYRGPCQESYYNIARSFHQIDLTSLAMVYYERALKCGPIKLSTGDYDNGCVDMTKEIAYNLRIIYEKSGAREIAGYITQKYLTI